MATTHDVRTWINRSPNARLDHKAIRQITDRTDKFDRRRGRMAQLSVADIRGNLFNGYPSAAERFLSEHPLMITQPLRTWPPRLIESPA